MAMKLDQDHYKQLSHKLIEQWQNEKVPLNPGATKQEIDGFEATVEVKLPDDFKYLYSLANGMRNSDRYFFELWSLTTISEKRDDGNWIYIDKSPFATHIPFGDWLIDSHRYYLVIKDSGNCYILIEAFDPPIFLESFTAFLEAYLSDPEKIGAYLI